MDKNFLDMAFDFLRGGLPAVAIEALGQSFNLVEATPSLTSGEQTTMFVVVGVVGQYKGSISLEASAETATALTQAMNFGEAIEELGEQYLYFAEFANMVGGKIITFANNAFRGANLRLTPPAVFSGRGLEVFSPVVQSRTAIFSGDMGVVTVTIGFEGV